MKYKSSSLLLLFSLCTACGNGKIHSGTQTDILSDTITTFVLPAIPPMLNTPELRADYLVCLLYTSSIRTQKIHQDFVQIPLIR